MDISGYVQQDELFVSTLTVQEHLNLQASFRLVGMNSKERQHRVNEVGKRKIRREFVFRSSVNWDSTSANILGLESAESKEAFLAEKQRGSHLQTNC